MKQYKCKGLKETKVRGWNQAFTKGDVYQVDPAMPKGYDTDGMLYLRGFFVDADQFEEVKPKNEDATIADDEQVEVAEIPVISEPVVEEKPKPKKKRAPRKKKSE